MSEIESSERLALDHLIKQVANLYSEPAVQQLYIEFFVKQAEQETISSAPLEVERVLAACQTLSLRSTSRFFKVESDYYDWDLQKRAFRLSAPSIHHLCKTVVFENKRCPHDQYRDPFDSRFYAVTVQYTSSIDTSKLVDFLRAGSNNRYSKKHYNLRLASPEVSLAC
ncbi:hypothetical protein DSO57_1037958 [Entomophthora muscae]|uniref:Uncharacterized protein n=1 Tax=Entomophthora muscae TaxID=34485 RepID=A0ACC2U988_9FUNG|nr:hypothetical protein DSO57_1037958 [Entomophthora muscae]